MYLGDGGENIVEFLEEHLRDCEVGICVSLKMIGSDKRTTSD
jgi:hypothetical protein